MNRTTSESHTFSHTAVNKAASQLYKPVKIHRSSSWFTASSASYCSMLLAQMLNIQLCTVGSCRPSLSLSVSVCASPEPSHLTTPVCLLFILQPSSRLSGPLSIFSPWLLILHPSGFLRLLWGVTTAEHLLHLYRPPLSRQPSAGPPSPFLLKMLQTGTRAQTQSAQVLPSLCRWA